jgi:hypothetical protein
MRPQTVVLTAFWPASGDHAWAQASQRVAPYICEGVSSSRAQRILAPGGREFRSRHFFRCAGADPPSMRPTGYNARVDRLDAIRLLKALVAAGAKPRAPLDRAWLTG